MMKVKVAEAGNGLHPSETIVAIATDAGAQTLVVDKRTVMTGGYIGVGYPVRESGDKYLIELPRETSAGAWRVWVNKDQMFDAEPERRFA